MLDLSLNKLIAQCLLHKTLKMISIKANHLERDISIQTVVRVLNISLSEIKGVPLFYHPLGGRLHHDHSIHYRISTFG